MRRFSKKSKPNVPDWAEPFFKDRSNIKVDMNHPLGEGGFGVVYKGEILNIGGVAPNKVLYDSKN